MRKHLAKANGTESITGIDAAIRKYGIENFEVTTICECPDEDLDFQEKFYIAKFDTFYGDGYNLTEGGQNGSVLKIKPKEVIDKYEELKVIKSVAEYFNCCSETISKILKANNVEIKVTPHNLENLNKGKKFQVGDRTKKVRLIEFDLVFDSLKDCSQWLIDNHYSKASSVIMARKSLSRALNGDRATYCGLHFEFVD